MTRTPTPWGYLGTSQPGRGSGGLPRLQVPWRIAGGYAIELATGRPGGEHVDIDVLLLRRDRLAVQRARHPVAGRACREDRDAGPCRPERGGRAAHTEHRPGVAT